MKKWDKNQRFDTARDWIQVSMKRRGVTLDPDVVDSLAACCVKRNGVWRLRKTKPKTLANYLVWQAFKFAQHAHRWGNLAPWGDGFTAELMRANDSHRDLFERAFDQFCAVPRRSVA